MELASKVEVPYIVEISAFLLSVVVIVPLFKRLKITPVLGYLTIGTLIGPHALRVVDDISGVQHFAELGVVFLLFAIGLELSFNPLKIFATLIFGLGSAQMLICALVIGSVAYSWGNSPAASLIIGLCLALSSTAMVMQLLAERGEIASRHGRTAFSVLLLQDLAVVPILILLGALASDDRDNLMGSVLMSLARAAAVIAVIVLLGRFVLRYLFRIVSRTHSIDVFTAMSLLVILTTSLATGYAGLSMALGAFLAGALLAETEYQHQIEAEIEPFKGLLLGLFFMAVGMNLDLALAFQRGIWVLLSVIGLIAIKAVIITCLAILFRLRPGDALRTGILLAEAGEFAFVVISQASLQYQLIDADVGQFMVVVACLTMVLTPLLALIGRKLSAWIERFASAGHPWNPLMNSELHDHVVIAGYGRVGQAVSSVLTIQARTWVAIDRNVDRVAHCKKRGIPVILGDASRPELLRKTRIENAAALVITMDNANAAKQMVHIARRHCPELAIIVRAYDDTHSEELSQAGATNVVPELLEASLQMSTGILCALGMSREEAGATIDKIRLDHYDEIKRSV